MLQLFFAPQFTMKSALARFRPTEAPVPDPPEITATDKEAGAINEATVNADVENEKESDEISADAQTGVQKMEAITKTWTRFDLIVAYVT